ncbi:MAG: class I SAM-dependent methyltransferase [Pseudomonadota bacterium]
MKFELKNRKDVSATRPPEARMQTLQELGTRFGSDKAGHGFCAFYDELLADRRNLVTKVLEIGVASGASLRMWREYFPAAAIHGVDLSPASAPAGGRIVIHEADQARRDSLNRVLARTGSGFDVIIDDGGHTMEQQQVSLGCLFPHLRQGGLYVVEDLHSSFADEIAVTRGAQGAYRYSTGIHDGGPTTYQIVQFLAQAKRCDSLYLSAPEIDYLARNVAGARIFDRDGDRKHMTCALLHR